MHKTKAFFTDTETTGSLDNPIVYDFGGQTIEIDGTTFGETTNVVVDEVYYGMKDLMQTAYYADKLPQYEDEIWGGERGVENLLHLRKQIHELFKREGITVVCAHNARFDIHALNNTIRIITNGRVKYFFPYGVEVWDTLKMARQILGKMPTYRKFCEENGYMTNHQVPRPRMTAEIIYRFITKDITFTEAHTGLRDVEIETEIFKYLMRQHKKCDKVLYHAPKA